MRAKKCPKVGIGKRHCYLTVLQSRVLTQFCFSFGTGMKITDIEGDESESRLRIRSRRSVRIKKRKNVPYDEDTSGGNYKKKQSERINLHPSEEALRQRTEQSHRGYEDAEPSRSAMCKLSLEELKYAEFLQPKVVLSKSLSVTITQVMSEAEISETRENAAINMWFHNYAKPF